MANGYKVRIGEPTKSANGKRLMPFVMIFREEQEQESIHDLKPCPMGEDLKTKVIDTIDSLIPKGQNSLDLRTTDMVYGIYKVKEAVEKLFAEDSTQTNAESTQKSVVVTHDCVNRQDAITLMCRALHYNYEEGYAVTQMLALPSTDIDLSVYSDRLWRKAYEQGKAVSKEALDEAYAHGYTAAEADFHKKNQWIPVTERLPEIDMTFPHSERYLVQYEDGDMDVASWSNVNRFWTDHVTEPHWNCVQFQTVTAWMPLPECYRGDGNGE